jgi:phage tail sheath protein FI
MKKITIAIIVLLVSNINLAQNTKTLAKGMYSIKYPTSWKLDGTATATAFSIVDTTYDTANPFVENLNLIVSEISGYTPKTYADYAKTFLPTKIKTFKVIEEKEIKQGGKTGYYLVFKGKQDKDALKWKQIYFIEKNKLYTITFTAAENKYDEYIKKIASTIASFTIK